MNIDEYRNRLDYLYNRLDEIKEYEKKCIEEQEKIIVSKPAKDIDKKLKQLRHCSKFHEEKFRIRDEIERLYKEKRNQYFSNNLRNNINIHEDKNKRSRTKVVCYTRKSNKLGLPSVSDMTQGFSF